MRYIQVIFSDEFVFKYVFENYVHGYNDNGGYI